MKRLALDLEPATDLSKATNRPGDSDIPPVIPIIKIQRPSREPSETVPSDSVPTATNKRGAEETLIELDRAIEGAGTNGTDLAAVIPRPTDTELETTLTPVRIKKRKIALRKARNAAARRQLLKATLGRQLAEPTKEALQRLAKGEDVTVADIKVLG